MAYINGKHTTVNVNVYGEIPETTSGTVIYAVSMGLSRDCVVGTDYASELEAFTYPENIKYGDYMIDGDSACWFQYCELEDGEASLGGVDFRVICVANPNGKSEGAMVFKGVVDTLPDTANEGEVYKHSILADRGMITEVFEQFGYITVTPTSWRIITMALGSDFCNAITSAIDDGITNLEMVVWDMNGVEARYTINATHWANEYDEDSGQELTVIYGSTNVSDNKLLENEETGAIYGKEELRNTVVYHNGEWVEL